MRPGARLLARHVHQQVGEINGSRLDALTDTFGRFHNYLRMSLTEKCNLRCSYCMPAEGVPLTPAEQLLSLEERKQLLTLFASLGVTKLRFTGGEPSISNHLLPLVAHTQSLAHRMTSVGITSNGVALAHHLKSLQAAGLTSVNISLDTFDANKFATISRRDGKLLNKVLSSVFAASALQLSVKINCVITRGVNDNELSEFIRFARTYGIPVRFIELMPFDGNKWSAQSFVGYFEIIERMKRELNVELEREPSDDRSDTTKWYRIRGEDGVRIGFITSMSNNFCGTCNRLRITADGKLKVCLFGEEEFNLRDQLRMGSTTAELTDRLHQAILRKPAQLGGSTDAAQIASKHNNRPMILIGG